MTRADLLALAARVEQATAGDLDLDRAAARAMGWIGLHPTLCGDGLIGKPHRHAGWCGVPHFYGPKAAAALRAMAEGAGDE
jgi:hypothetical protein